MRKFQQNVVDTAYKILGVDDEAGILESLSIYVKRAGYNFAWVTNPTEAIELI